MDQETTDRRNARRFTMTLPLLVRFSHNGTMEEKSRIRVTSVFAAFTS